MTDQSYVEVGDFTLVVESTTAFHADAKQTKTYFRNLVQLWKLLLQSVYLWYKT